MSTNAKVERIKKRKSHPYDVRRRIGFTNPKLKAQTKKGKGGRVVFVFPTKQEERACCPPSGCPSSGAYFAPLPSSRRGGLLGGSSFVDKIIVPKSKVVVLSSSQTTPKGRRCCAIGPPSRRKTTRDYRASREGTSASASETNATKGIFEEDMTKPRTPETPTTSRFRGETTRESIAYRRYLAVYDRTVEFAARTKDGGEGKISIEYDIVGHPRLGFRFVAVLPFHSRTKEFTLCREYIQSVNASGLTVPTGGHEPEKHGEDIANAARAEMNEEAQLVGGTLVNLMEKKSENGKDRTVGDEEGFIETKWCRNRFVPFLCVDPQDVEEGEEGKLDVEEFALESFRVSLTELKRIMYSGEMMLPSIITCQMSLDYLVKSGLISRDEYHGC